MLAIRKATPPRTFQVGVLATDSLLLRLGDFARALCLFCSRGFAATRIWPRAGGPTVVRSPIHCRHRLSFHLGRLLENGEESYLVVPRKRRSPSRKSLTRAPDPTLTVCPFFERDHRDKNSVLALGERGSLLTLSRNPMVTFRRTSKRRYMWGMGVACSLFVVAVAASWAIEGSVDFRVRGFGSESVVAFQEKSTPVPFWSITGATLAVGMAGALVTGVGLARVQKEEAQPVARHQRA